MIILGVSAYYHDSAAALLADGHIVAAAQEERFTRRKHDDRFPEAAVDFCLRQAGLTRDRIDYVVFYDKPLLKFDRLLETYLAFAPRGWRSFMASMPVWLKSKLNLRREIRRRLGPDCTAPIVFTRHHESHAASAFYPSPFDEAAILTIDGVGEWHTATLGVGRGPGIELRQAQEFPHSLGLLYSAFTYFCGFRVNSGEYKLMGLAPYGRPRYADRILEKLIDVRPDGSFAMDMRYFNYCTGLTMTNRAFAKLFDGPPRTPEAEISQREMDLAASVQTVTEEIVLRMARHARESTGCPNLCLAGGVALNCVANGRLLRERVFDRIWIQPAAGDAGGALGAALFCHHQLLGNPRTPNPHDSQQGSFLGPAFDPDSIRRDLEAAGRPHRHFQDEESLLEAVVDGLVDGRVVGWFHGRMEFGPRALGARSILADPRRPEMQSVLNRRIKFRESFRPFAPSILAEHTAEWFDLDGDSPYMLIVAPLLDRHRRNLSPSEEAIRAEGPIRERLRAPLSSVPAITHLDYSARVQTVDARHGRYQRLLAAFHRRTGCPMLVNTSFNIRGEPVVANPQDAYRCFMGTDMDWLVLEDCLLQREEQPAGEFNHREHYHESFPLD